MPFLAVLLVLLVLSQAQAHPALRASIEDASSKLNEAIDTVLSHRALQPLSDFNPVCDAVVDALGAPFDCTCRYGALRRVINFECTSLEEFCQSIPIGPIQVSVCSKYTVGGAVKITPVLSSGFIEGNICLTNATISDGEDVFTVESFCASLGLCDARRQLRPDICECSASLEGNSCTCLPCEEGFGIDLSCGSDLLDISCIELGGLPGLPGPLGPDGEITFNAPE